MSEMTPEEAAGILLGMAPQEEGEAVSWEAKAASRVSHPRDSEGCLHLARHCRQALDALCMGADAITRISQLEADLREARAQLAEARRDAEKRRWRPISEMHEDHSCCVVMNIHDPNPPHVACTLDDDFEENVAAYGWTHFQQILFTTDEAYELLATEADHGKE